jgi:hypothetical protein
MSSSQLKSEESSISESVAIKQNFGSIRSMEKKIDVHRPPLHNYVNRQEKSKQNQTHVFSFQPVNPITETGCPRSWNNILYFQEAEIIFDWRRLI